MRGRLRQVGMRGLTRRKHKILKIKKLKLLFFIKTKIMVYALRVDIWYLLHFSVSHTTTKPSIVFKFYSFTCDGANYFEL